jgi:flagellum-specific peptidoglycan hydrolase FlgJ
MAALVAVEFDPFKASTTPDDFASRYGAAAEKAAKALGVDPNVVLGQWGLETGWGKSVIPGTNNLGNIKDFSGKGTAATDNMTGSRDKYRAYESPDQFVDDYVSLIQRKYPNAVNAKTPEDFAKALKSGGYAEDPGYVSKVTTAAKMTPVKAKEPTLSPVDFDPFAQQPGEAPEQEGGAAFGVYPKARRDAKNNTSDAAGSIIKGVASGLADVGNTIINSGTKAGADTVSAINDPYGLIDPRLKRGPQSSSPAEQQNTERAQGLKDFNAENKNALFTGGRITGNILATYPVGGALGSIAKGGGLPVLGSAIASGGMTTGRTVAPGAMNALADMGVRMAGGAVAGGASAGLVDPDSAGTGAMVSAALPPVVKGLGALGSAAARVIRGPEAPESVRAAAAAAREAGYVIPPTQVRPTLTNRLLEGTAGKITTAQNASARNQQVTNKLAQKAIGAEELTPEALQAVRSRANEAYSALAQAGQFNADDAFREALKKAGAPSEQLTKDFPALANGQLESLVKSFSNTKTFDAGSAIEAIKVLRAAQRASAASADPAVIAMGRAQGKISNALEDLVERNLSATGDDALLATYREARKTLAKVYDVEKALNPASGNVDAKKLANLLKKGRLTDELKQIGEFAGSFPKAAQTLEGMGSLPQTSPLDWTAAGGIAAATGGSPVAALGLLARPTARAAALSPMVQNRLAQPQALPMLTDATRRNLLQPLYRAGPVLASDR